MIFVGSKVFTHARYWQIKKYVCMIFVWGGGGGHAPPPPVATPLDDTSSPSRDGDDILNVLITTTLKIECEKNE